MLLVSWPSTKTGRRAHAIVRAVVRQGIARGCQTFIIREGWEGLVRGNTADITPAATPATFKNGSDPSSPNLKPLKPSSVSFASLPPSKQLELQRADDKLASIEAGAPHAFSYTNPEEVMPLSAAPLSFGYGELLKDGAGEADENALADAQRGGLGARVADAREPKGKTLKGKYIVRVGWDDVRGWLGEGGTLIGSSRCPSCEYGMHARMLFIWLTP
jgi:6-phosphofructokinase 1